MNILLSKRLLSVSLSVLILGVIGIVIVIKTTSNKQQAEKVKISEQRRLEDQVKIQGQVAGVAVTIGPTPIPTVRLYKPSSLPTYTHIPLNSSQPQTNINTSSGNNSQSSQNTSSNTSVVNPTNTPVSTNIPASSTPQPTSIPPTPVPNTTQLEIIGINTTEGTVTANKPLKECYVTGGEYTGTSNVALATGKRNVEGNVCILQNKAPDFINITGKVVDFDGQEKSFN